jgi:uncharacterized protein (TIGR03435 family)
MLNHCGRVAVVAAMAVASASAQQPPLQFEVASVKASSPLDVQKVMTGQQRLGMRTDAGRVDIDGLPLMQIIVTAFRVKPYQVTAPGWVGSGMNVARFDIHATLPEGAKTEQVPEMLQALLAERFKLTFHRENKEQPVYALIVGKNGPKLVESPSDLPAGDAAAPAAAAPPVGRGPGPSGLIGRGGAPAPIKAGRGAFTIAGGGTGPIRMSMSPEGVMHLEVEKMTMAQLADTLTPLVDRPVVDQTGLKGSYKFVLDLAREDMLSMVKGAGVNLPPGALGAGPGGATAAADPSGGGSVFRSVEQLGLKLDSRKVPMEVIVIDHLERTPTED